MKNILLTAIATFISLSGFSQSVSDYNVVWTTPSVNSGGSMPIGNGELGMNVWVEEGGDLLFYLSRTDVMSEANRLMKIGRVRVTLTPNQFKADNNFTQKLLLDEGVIEISTGKQGDKTILRIFLDQSYDVAHITVTSDKGVNIKATAESWRRKPHIITSEESGSAWTTNPLPEGMILTESADTYTDEQNAVSWYHHNNWSVYDITISHQQKESVKEHFPDPIKNRIWGAYMSGTPFGRTSDSTLQSKGIVKNASLKISTRSEQEPLSQWKKQIKADNAVSVSQKALSASNTKWKDYWNRSYIFVDIPSDKELGFNITQSYILQRYMSCAGGSGTFPIKFNGSIFTTDPQNVNPGIKATPDYRAWGNEFWWQNTRLPYYPMLQTGDYELMKPLFDFYIDRIDAMSTLAKKYYGAEGFFIPETMTIFGTYANGDYGWDRKGLTPNDVATQWIGRIWVQSLELSKIMLDYYSYTGDRKFLDEKAIPTIYGALKYFDSRFIGEDGKMRITPTQSLETYWFNVLNDMPAVSGLHYVVEALETLPSDAGTSKDRELWGKIKKSLPPLPTKTTVAGTQFIPAEEYLEKVSNVENPELYTIFPFGLANFSNDLKDTGLLSFRNRRFASDTGWGQAGQLCAMLGLTDEAVSNLKSKTQNTNPGHRFTAMWGPNYDWVPDQDHGSNLLMTLQYMILQSYGDKTYVLPAWDSSWNVSFKLNAPDKTTVIGDFRDGKLTVESSGNSEIIKMK